MPIATRNAEVTWDGSLAHGSGVRGNVKISIDAILESLSTSAS